MPTGEGEGLQGHFGAAVRVLRERQGLHLEELARRLEVEAEELRDLEAGGKGPELKAQDLMNRLGAALGVEMAQLATQAEWCRQARVLRQLADAIEAGPGAGTRLQQVQIRVVRAVLFGQVEDFEMLVDELHGIALGPEA